MRLDRFFEARFPGLSFSHIQRIIRKGEVRVDGRRASPRTACRPGRRCASRRSSSTRRSRAKMPGEDSKEPRLSQVDHALRGQRRPGPQQADGPCGAGRIRHDPPRGRHSGRASRRRRPAAPPRSPARQGYRRLPRSSPRPASPPPPWQKRSARVRRARYTGRWSPACRSRARAASRPIWPRRARRRCVMRVAKHGDEGASHALTYYATVDTAARPTRLAFAQAGDRPHPPAARPRGAYRPSDRRRSEIFRQGKLGAARRHAEPASPVGAPDRGRASARRAGRHHGAASAAHAAEVEAAGFDS